FNFLDKDGNSVEHSINRRVMSVDLDTLKEAKNIVLSSGGAHRAVEIRATIKRIGCKTLITDESAARALLELDETSPSATSPQQREVA
ncbi:sugar-binding domain-containing protein, partial [Rhizobium ruizarguesonis]